MSPRLAWKNLSVSWSVILLYLTWLPAIAIAYNMPDMGYATLTHYGLPKDAIAACGCTAASTQYPTAALSSLAYGSTNAFGPGCGKCFRMTLVCGNRFLSDPPWYPASTKSIVIKVTDLCPAGGSWCNATETSPNAAGEWINFDLAYPSPAIPDDFYPQNTSYYGYSDFGVWNASYVLVACEGNWAGATNQNALGSVASIGPEGACCPADPITYPNTTCPSYSAHNGTAPDTQTNSVSRVSHPPTLALLAALFLPILTR